MLEAVPLWRPWEPFPASVTVIACFLGSYIIRSLLLGCLQWLAGPTLDLPTAPKPSGTDFRETMREGINRYPDRAWVMPFEDPTVILPHSTIEQLSKIPEPQLTLNGNMYRRFFGRYTQIGTDDAELIDALKLDLTSNVPNMLREMKDEIAYAYDATVGGLETGDWKAFSTYPAMLRIIAFTSGRAFVGLPLSRTESWIQSSVQHTVGSVQLSDHLRGSYPAWVRPLVAPFVRERKQVREVQAQMDALLLPIIDKHTRPTPKNKASEEARMVTWLLGRYGKTPPRARLVRDHLTLCFAAIHVASIAMTHVLHDLAARPEYMRPLREELEAELAQSPDGVLTGKGLANLVKMESFIKESLRLSPSGIAWTRLTTGPLTLPTGETLPHNTLIAYCNPRFNPSLDIYEKPDEFDGFRFVKLVEQHGRHARFRLDGASIDSLAFGYGLHLCPGRSFAVAELKLALAHLIRHYDLRLEEGQTRPENLYVDFQILPDPNAMIYLRHRST